MRGPEFSRDNSPFMLENFLEADPEARKRPLKTTFEP